MQLLGNFSSNLTAFLYEQLLAQLETSISKGEYAAGSLFDTSAAAVIQAEGQNFSTIILPSAGETSFVEDINVPLDKLQARYIAIENEVSLLQDTIPRLLDIISKETSLLDKTIAAAEVEKWGSQQPALSTAQVFQWSFESGYGVTTTVYPQSAEELGESASSDLVFALGLAVFPGTYKEDPLSDIIYTAPTPIVSYVISEYLSGDGIVKQGIGSPITRRTIPIKTIQWSFTPNSLETQFETVYSTDKTWASLSTLEPNPILIFGAPNIQTLLPIGGSVTGVFLVSGSVVGGSLPIYVRILFHPRQHITVIHNAAAAQQIQLSPYNVTANTVKVFTPSNVYVPGLDYIMNDHSVLTIVSTGALVGMDFSILFEEYFPAYQCSIDQTNWSPIFMLDPLKPYPDDTVDFLPIDIQNSKFPLSDELGVPLGLFIQMIGVPTSELLLLITTPGSQVYGEHSKLTITLQRAVYMNGLQLEPFTNFPAVIQSIVAYGFTDNIQTTVLDIPILLDRSMIIKFPRQLTRKFVINFYQQNYSLKEYVIEGHDALRRNTLADLQSTLPFSVQRPVPAIPRHFEGALYEFGVKNIVAVDDQVNLPGVFVSGPHRVKGMPEIIRLDADLENMPGVTDVYLAYLAYDGNEQVLDQDEIAFVIGSVIKYPSVIVADHVDFFIKFVLRNELSIAKKIQLQVTIR